jgi:IS30 family transposase
MRDWKQVHIDAGIDVFFCDPRMPPGSAAPTRTPTGCCASTSPRAPDFSTVTEAQLDAVADELNARPRKRLDFANPTEQLGELLLQ